MKDHFYNVLSILYFVIMLGVAIIIGRFVFALFEWGNASAALF